MEDEQFSQGGLAFEVQAACLPGVENQHDHHCSSTASLNHVGLTFNQLDMHSTKECLQNG